MRIKLKLLVAAISITIIPNIALAQGQSSPGGGGPATTLSSLGCGPAEIARVNGADEWECSADLTANEAAAAAAQTTADGAVNAAAAAQVTADGAQATANTAVSAAAAAQSTANSAQSRADGAVGDAAAAQSAADGAQVTADGALAIGSDALSRVETLEGQDVEARIGSLEQAVFPVSPIPGGNLAGLDLGFRSFNDPIDVDGFAPGVNFAGSIASGFARFVRTDLRGANFAGIGGTANWVFEGADLRGATFAGVTTGRFSFRSSSIIGGVSFHGANLGRQGLEIQGLIATHLDVRSTTINGPNFSGRTDFSDFSDSVWSSDGSFSTALRVGSCMGCKFNRVNFSDWDNFGGNAEIEITVGAQHSEWRFADLEGLIIRNNLGSVLRSDFQYADFRNSNLQDATLRNLILTDSLFSGANLSGVSWENVICPDGTASADAGGTCEFNLID